MGEPSRRCSMTRGRGGCRRTRSTASSGTGAAPLEVDLGVVVLGTDGPDVAQPVAVVVLGGALERIGQGPRLALVRPVVRLEPMGLAEPRDGGVLMALAPQVLAELEGRSGARVLGG